MCNNLGRCQLPPQPCQRVTSTQLSHSHLQVILHHKKQIENVVNQGLHNPTQVEYIPQQNQWHTS